MYSPALVAAIGMFGVVGPVIYWLSRRFERRRKQEGTWDQNGPLHPVVPDQGIGTHGQGGLAVAFAAFLRVVTRSAPGLPEGEEAPHSSRSAKSREAP